MTIRRYFHLPLSCKKQFLFSLKAKINKSFVRLKDLTKHFKARTDVNHATPVNLKKIHSSLGKISSVKSN